MLSDKRSELERIKAESDQLKASPVYKYMDVIKDCERLSREVVDAFIDHIVVYAPDRYEIIWKTRDEITQGNVFGKPNQFF